MRPPRLSLGFVVALLLVLRLAQLAGRAVAKTVASSLAAQSAPAARLSTRLGSAVSTRPALLLGKFLQLDNQLRPRLSRYG